MWQFLIWALTRLSFDWRSGFRSEGFVPVDPEVSECVEWVQRMWIAPDRMPVHWWIISGVKSAWNVNSHHLFSKCMLLVVLWTVRPWTCLIFDYIIFNRDVFPGKRQASLWWRMQDSLVSLNFLIFKHELHPDLPPSNQQLTHRIKLRPTVCFWIISFTQMLVTVSKDLSLLRFIMLFLTHFFKLIKHEKCCV